MAVPKVFSEAKRLVLGSEYDLSFALISRGRAAELNRRYRGRPYSADILSFPLSQNEGEILINKDTAPTAARLRLFIHGLLHLKGLTHGSKMKRKEQELTASLTHHGKNNSRWTRHWHLSHSASCGGGAAGK